MSPVSTTNKITQPISHTTISRLTFTAVLSCKCEAMPPPNLVRHVFICASVAAVLIVAGLLASSYEGTTPTQPKGNETLLAARWMNMPFVGAAPHAASLRCRRRRSGKIFKTIQSSRNLADITGSSATNVTSPAKPTTAAVNTSSPLYRPTNVPSQHPSTAPSTVTPSEKPTASVSSELKSPYRTLFRS